MLRREDVRRPTLLVDVQDAGTGRRRSCVGPEHRDQRPAASGVGEDLLNARFAAGTPEQGAGLALLLDRVQRASEGLEVVGLLDEIDRPALHRLDGRIDRPFAGDHHHRGLGPNDAQPVEDFQPGGLRHPEVQEGHFERLAVHRLQGGGAIGRGHDLMPIFAEEPREFVSKRRVVVRDEDFHSAPARGNSTVKADPTPGSEVTSIVPPWPVTTCFERTRPSPVS